MLEAPISATIFLLMQYIQFNHYLFFGQISILATLWKGQQETYDFSQRLSENLVETMNMQKKQPEKETIRDCFASLICFSPVFSDLIDMSTP